MRQKQACSLRFPEEPLQPVMHPGLCGVSDAACTNLSQGDLWEEPLGGNVSPGMPHFTFTSFPLDMSMPMTTNPPGSSAPEENSSGYAGMAQTIKYIKVVQNINVNTPIQNSHTCVSTRAKN